MSESLSELDKEARWEVNQTRLNQLQGQGQLLEELLEAMDNAKTELAATVARANRTLRN